MKAKKEKARIDVINSALGVDKRVKKLTRSEHKDILKATGMAEQMIEAALDAWETEPRGLMWYHSREWLKETQKDLRQGRFYQHVR